MHSKMFIETETDRVNLYLSHPKGGADNYMQYCLRHFTDPYKDGGTYQNQDVWRMYEMYAYHADASGQMVQTKPYCILNGGEWECALRIDQTPDFHGGLHGYEHQKSVFASGNGRDITLGVKSDLRETESFEFVQCSEIYRQGTRNEVIAKHVKHYIFKEGKMMLHQELEWQQAVTILYAYMAMLPIKRTSDNTPEGEPISDYVILGDSDTVYDVRKIGHNTGISSVADHVRNVRYAKIWGEASGITAELHIDCPFLESNNFFVQNTEAYNKFYFSYAGDGDGYAVQPGEKWAIDTQYEIYQK